MIGGTTLDRYQATGKIVSTIHKIQHTSQFLANNRTTLFASERGVQRLIVVLEQYIP